MRNGRDDLNETALTRFALPLMSPTVLPESHMNTFAIESLPSPAATTRCESADHAMSRIGPPSTGVSSLRICSGLSHAQIRTTPDAAPDAT